MMIDFLLSGIIALSIFAIIAIFSENPGNCPSNCKIDHKHIFKEEEWQKKLMVD